MFELEYEAFGLRMPEPASWQQMTRSEKDKNLGRAVEIYARIVERFKWDAVLVFSPWGDPDGVRAVKQALGKEIAVGGLAGTAGNFSIDTVTDWMQFASRMADDRKGLHEESEQMCRAMIKGAGAVIDAGADFVFVPSDVAFNGGPFISPADFSELVTPYLERQIRFIKERGVKAIFHSDGQMMPVMQDILSCEPDCFMSVDPMAGMDIAELKKTCRGKMALMGNVQCSFLQSGTKEEIKKSTLYCLENASEGGGYIFSSSNTIFKGVPLENYEYMLSLYHDFFKV